MKRFNAATSGIKKIEGRRHVRSDGQTIADVARLAGVSIGTVSHVLNHSRYVRPETRRRVEEAVAKLGFRPSRVAQALVRHRTGTIGMILPDIANPFFAELLRGAVDTLGAVNYAAFLGDSDNSPSKERRYVHAFRDRRVDGMIWVIAADADADEILALGTEAPMVIVDRMVPGWTGDSVVCDNVAGMGLAVEHLVSLGHRRIALINGDPRLSTAQERRVGFERALLLHKLAPAAMAEGSFTLESGHEQAAALLASPGRPTGICAANDLLALGALAAARELNIRVPVDLSIVGYDDIPYARLSTPSLTTVRQPAREMGSEASRLILDRVEGLNERGRRVVLQPQLVVRQSTTSPR